MGERLYMLLLGIGIILGLYFDIPYFVYLVIALHLIEAAFNPRLGSLLNKLPLPGFSGLSCGFEVPHEVRMDFDAKRLWHLIIATILGISYIAFFDHLWFLVWFLGFVLAGAGLSGVCPMLFILQKAGFR